MEALGANRHADSNFLRALDHHVGHNAVEPDSSEERGQESEETRKGGHQLILNQGVLNARLESQKFKVDSGIHVGNRFLHRRDEVGQRQRGANEDVIVRAGFFLLSGREIHEWQKFLMHVLKLIIRCHSHNLVEWARLPWGLVDTEALAKRISDFEDFARKSLIHDRDLGRSSGVAAIEVASGEEGCSNGFKIARAEKIFPGHTCVLVRTFVDDLIIPGASAKWDKHGVGGGFDTGDGLHALDEIAFVVGVAFLGKLQPREINAGDQDSGLLKADIQGGQVAQTPDKKKRTHQKDNREAHLRNDKNAPKTKALAADGRSPAPRLE